MRVLIGLFALTLAACAGPARAQDAAETFAPLIGCWGKERQSSFCFERLDAHVVMVERQAGAQIGETTYHDNDAGLIIFAYAGADGARGHGVLRADNGRFVVEPHTIFEGDGRTRRLRAQWRLETPDTLLIAVYEEVQEGQWLPLAPIVRDRVRQEPH